jgi:hypothetical protein
MSILRAGTTTTTALTSIGNTDGTLQFQVNGTTPSVTLNALGAVGVGAVPAFGTSGQVLTSGGSTAAPTWTTVTSSQWTTSGSNIFYNTGDVGIGTSSPVSKLDVVGAANTGDPALPYQLRIASTEAFNASPTAGIMFANKFNTGGSYAGMGGIEVGKENATDGNFASYLAFLSRPAGDAVTEQMRLNSSGNLGLGVTPSAWGAATKAIDITGFGSVGGSTGFQATTNSFFNGTNWIYKNTATAALYTQNTGVHAWFNAGSGTAGNAISFTQAMTLDASGNLGVGTTSPGVRLDVAGGLGRFIPSGGSANSPESGAGSLNVYGESSSISTRTGTLRLESFTDQNTDTGPTIAFSGRYITSNASSWTLAKIGGYKENNNSGGPAGYLSFATTVNAGSLVERFRISSVGAWGLSGANYGTSGQVLTSQGSGSPPIWATAGSGLTLVSTTNVTSTTTIDINLSSSFNNYLIVINNLQATIQAPTLYMRVLVGGVVQSGASDYGRQNSTNAINETSFSTSDFTTISASNANSGSFPGRGVNAFINLHGANISGPKTWFANSTQTSSGGVFNAIASAGAYTGTSNLSGIRIFWSGGQTFAAQGTIRLYGLSN